MRIREATQEDLNAVLDVNRRAFGEDDEAALVQRLLSDPDAHPLISLLAEEDSGPVGHILLTSTTINASDDGAAPVASMLLAPLSVVPDAQHRGIGGMLVKEAMERAHRIGVGIVFVLGHPEYYPRHGFTPAGVWGLEAPYPIPEKDADAWMAIDLAGDTFGSVRGRVRVAPSLMRPEYWRE